MPTPDELRAALIRLHAHAPTGPLRARYLQDLLLVSSAVSSVLETKWTPCPSLTPRRRRRSTTG